MLLQIINDLLFVFAALDDTLKILILAFICIFPSVKKMNIVFVVLAVIFVLL